MQTKKYINEGYLYFMMAIELNRLCIEKSNIKVEFSSEMDTVINLRKNNKFSLALTLTNELNKILQKIISKEETITVEEKIIVCHMFKKLEILMEESLDPKSSEKEKTENKSEQEQKKEE